MNNARFTDYGIDYEKGMHNCMDNLAFYKKILSMFLEDGCFASAKKAHESGDHKELFARMHELKGVSGNAALSALYEASIPLVELLRNATGVDAAKEAQLFAALESAYERTCEGIAVIIAEA